MVYNKLSDEKTPKWQPRRVSLSIICERYSSDPTVRENISYQGLIKAFKSHFHRSAELHAWPRGSSSTRHGCRNSAAPTKKISEEKMWTMEHCPCDLCKPGHTLSGVWARIWAFMHVSEEQFDRSYHKAFNWKLHQLYTSRSVHLSWGALLPTVSTTVEIDVIMSSAALEGDF